MTREEAVDFIDNNYICREWDKEKFIEAIEVLKGQLSLPEILGWEEGLRYRVDNRIFKLGKNYKNKELEIKEFKDERWKICSTPISEWSIEFLRNAVCLDNPKDRRFKLINNELKERPVLCVNGFKRGYENISFVNKRYGYFMDGFLDTRCVFSKKECEYLIDKYITAKTCKIVEVR